MDQIYGPMDWQKDGYHINKVDYIARFAYPGLFMLVVLAYMSVFLFPWLASRYS